MKTIQLISYPIIIEEVPEEGGYIAYVPSLPGCHTQGETIEEVQRNMQEAVDVYLESIAEHTKYIPKPLRFYQSTINVKLPA